MCGNRTLGAITIYVVADQDNLATARGFHHWTRFATCAHCPGLRVIAVARPRLKSKRTRSRRGPSIRNSHGATGTRKFPLSEKIARPFPSRSCGDAFRHASA